MDDEKDENKSEGEDFDDSEIGIPIGDIVMPVRDSDGEAAEQPDLPQEAEKDIEMLPELEERVDMSHEAGYAGDFPQDTDEQAEMLPETEQEDTETAIGPAHDESPVLEAVEGLKQHLETLIDEFETKIKVDEHKNKVIDTLHDELQGFREGIIKKHLYSFVTDVIKIIDDIRKFKNHYDGEPVSEEVVSNLLTFLDSIASDLEDLFAWQGVMPFTCDSPVFDNSRQRVIKKIDTDDPAKDKTVAESLRPGYEWDGKMIRPEMVAVYVCTNTSNGEDSST